MGEAHAFLNQVMGLELTHEQIDSLAERTQGWVAGLQMEALSLQGDKVQAVPLANERQFITEYLLTEILNQQIPRSRHSCSMRLSWISFRCRFAGQSFLRRRVGYFLKSKSPIFLSPGWAWYSTIRSFESFSGLNWRTNPLNVEELHSQAAHWFEQNGMIVEAIPQALAIETMKWRRARSALWRPTISNAAS